jgi:predicted MFS family arabinose efflux permease
VSGVAATARVPLLRQPAYRRYFTCSTVSVFGDQVSALAIPLAAILVLHAPAFDVGLLTSAAWLPNLLFALPAGVWIDTHPHRRAIMIAADVARAAILLTIPLAWWAGVLSIEQLLAVTFLAGTLKVFFDLSSVSLTIALVPREQYAEGQSRMFTSMSVANVTGPSIAGGLVQVLGAPVAILADAASFVFSAFMLRGLSVREPEVTASEERASTRLRSALAHVFRDPLLRASLLCTGTINFFNFVLLAVFVVFASRTLGLSASTIGLVLGAGAFGGLVGSLVGARVGDVLGRGRAVLLGAAVFPAALVLFPLAHGSHALAASMLLAGELLGSVFVVVFDINQNTILALHVPEALRSRVFGAYRFLNYGTRPLGALVGGALAAWIGLRLTLWVGVLGGMTAALWLIGSPLPRAREEDYA